MARNTKPRGVAIKPEPLSARPRLVDVEVSSPTVPGAVEKLKRVADTIEGMWRRKQLGSAKDLDHRAVENERSYRAAQRLRNAHDVVYGSIGGVMDFDRVRGGGAPGSPPPLHYREAADVLIDAKSALFAVEDRVLNLIVCQGFSIEEAAQRVRHSTERAAKEEIGHILRSGLTTLADAWFEPGDVKRKTVRPYHAPDADPRANPYSSGDGAFRTGKTTVVVGTIKAGGTASASRNRVQRN